MKLHATLNDSKTEIQITDEGPRVFVEVENRKYEFQVEESAAGSYLMIHNNRVFDCRVESRPESGKPVTVIVGQTEYRVTLADPRRLRGTTRVEAGGDDMARIVAPMPGKVARVLVAVGDPVNVGDGVVVVEAMKMQNEMKSPKAGTVTSLNAKPGATVNAGDVLAVIE